MAKLKFIYYNWKLIVHLLLRTKRFGVNNNWQANFDSIFGISFYQRARMLILIEPFILNYKLIKMRAIHLGFLHPDTIKLLGWKEAY